MVVIVVILGVAFNFAVSEWMKSAHITDIEYLGNFAAHVEYYEPWDEWEEETCTNDNGEEYDCSHSIYHEARWTMVDYDGYSYSIERREYNDIVQYVNVEPVFKELHRDYYRIDGNMYYADIPEKRLIIPITRAREYKNRILTNQSLYHYKIVSDEEKDSLGLYDYPEIVHYSPHPYPNPYPKSVRSYQPSTRGLDEGSLFTAQMDMVNAKCGHYLRTFIFFYPDKEREIAKKQIDRLQLGNFNELIIMLGTQGDEITWCETHSWEDVPAMRTAVKQWFAANNNMSTLPDFPIWYILQIEAGLWTLKDYHDFDYIRISFSLAQIAGLCIAQIVFQIFVFLYSAFFIRRIEKIRVKYGPLDEKTKHWLKQRDEIFNKKIMRDEKLTRQEWKIFNDAKQFEVCQERERKRQKDRDKAIRGNIAGLLTCVAILPHAILILLLMSFELSSGSLFAYIPCAINILAIPVFVSSIIVLKRIKKKEAGWARYGK